VQVARIVFDILTPLFVLMWGFLLAFDESTRKEAVRSFQFGDKTSRLERISIIAVIALAGLFDPLGHVFGERKFLDDEIRNGCINYDGHVPGDLDILGRPESGFSRSIDDCVAVFENARAAQAEPKTWEHVRASFSRSLPSEKRAPADLSSNEKAAWYLKHQSTFWRSMSRGAAEAARFALDVVVPIVGPEHLRNRLLGISSVLTRLFSVFFALVVLDLVFLLVRPTPAPPSPPSRSDLANRPGLAGLRDGSGRL
jgi:hypothetical protein